MDKAILIIDDEVQVIQMLKLLLCDDAERIDGVTSAAQARSLLAEQAYDAVISDICMPGESGLELLRAMSAVTPAARWVMITAYNSRQVEEECRAAGAAAFFAKPFHLGDVRAAVLQLLDAA